MLGFRVRGARQNFYEFSFDRNLELYDRIFDCLLTAMAGLQAEVVRVSFIFVGNLDGHHQEWLGSTTTSVFDFGTVSGCDQLVVSSIYARGGTLDLLMTDIPDYGTGCYCSTHR